MTYPPSGSVSAKSTSSDTPRKLVPSFDHFVTQWMSQGTVSCGSSPNCAAVHSRGSPTIPSIRKLHPSGSTRGVGPAVRTGKPCSMYWPGGRRSASSGGTCRRPVKPREKKPLMVLKSRYAGHRYAASIARRTAVTVLAEYPADDERVLQLRLRRGVELAHLVDVDRPLAASRAGGE